MSLPPPLWQNVLDCCGLQLFFHATMRRGGGGTVLTTLTDLFPSKLLFLSIRYVCTLNSTLSFSHLRLKLTWLGPHCEREDFRKPFSLVFNIAWDGGTYSIHPRVDHYRIPFCSKDQCPHFETNFCYISPITTTLLFTLSFRSIK